MRRTIASAVALNPAETRYGTTSPVAGRVLDRRGFLLPVRVALTAAVAVSIGLALSPRPLLYVPLVIAAGGQLDPTDSAWEFRGYRHVDCLDPEGNVVQLRERAST